MTFIWCNFNDFPSFTQTNCSTKILLLTVLPFRYTRVLCVFLFYMYMHVRLPIHPSIQYQVAWIKADTKAILAIHEHVITNNARLSVTHNDYNTWTLNIRDVRREDRGQYMCQVNTDPMKMQVNFDWILIVFYFVIIDITILGMSLLLYVICVNMCDNLNCRLDTEK